MVTDTISIIGATGDVGGKTIRALQDLGVPVRAIARRPDQVAGFEAAGVPAALASLDDVAGLARALEGSDQVMLITALGREQSVHGRNAVVAAKTAGVRAIVHLSTADASPASAVPWARSPWHTDELIKISGLDYTILHPSGFMQNFLQFAAPISRGFLPQTTGRGAVAWIDTHDIARTAATILRHGVHTGTEPVLTGPALLTARDVAAVFATVLERKVRYLHLPSRVFAAIIRSAGVDRETAEGLRQQFARVVRHGLDHADARTDDIQHITGTPATSLEQWIHTNQEHFTRQ